MRSRPMANAPFKVLALPPAMARVQTRLAGASGGDRQMVALLVAAHENGVEAVERACAEALEAGLRSADAILNILSRQSRKASAEPVTPPAHLRLREEPIADCARLTTSSSQRLAVERHELIELMRGECPIFCV